MFSDMTTPRKIKAAIITGFLGAGKTTFINNLPRKYPDKQFDLVENEFGEVPVNTRLIKGVDASQLFELKYGCICCTITNEYELVLVELAGRFPEVNELLIETTGIADPAQIIKPFTNNPEIRSFFEFQGIICIADARNYEFHIQEKVSVRQLISDGAIVISKSEGFSHDEQIAMVNRLKELNDMAPVFYTLQSQTEFETGNFWNNKPFFRPYLLQGNSFQAVGSSWEIKEGDLALDNKSGVVVFVGKLADISFDGIDKC